MSRITLFSFFFWLSKHSNTQETKTTRNSKESIDLFIHLRHIYDFTINLLKMYYLNYEQLRCWLFATLFVIAA